MFPGITPRDGKAIISVDACCTMLVVLLWHASVLYHNYVGTGNCTTDSFFFPTLELVRVIAKAIERI